MSETPTPIEIAQTSEPSSQRFSPALLILAVIPLLGLVAAIGMLLGEQSVRTGQNDGAFTARVGSLDQPMPDFVPVTLGGEPVDLTQYRGRPIFINFWGTWCPPCVEELPALQAFAESQGDDGAVIIASNNTENAETIYAFLDEHGFSLPDIQFVLDPDSTMYRWFGVYQAPSTFLIDRDGFVRSVKYGAFTVEGMQQYLADLEASSRGS